MRLLDKMKYLKKNNCLFNPIILQIEITDICPLNCKQCYKDLENQGEMSFEKFCELAYEAKEIGVKQIVLNGGEPLIHSRIIDIILKLNDLDIVPVCFTSGYGLNREFLEKIKDTKIELLLSLNGSNSEIHNKSRDGFNITMKSVELLNELNFKYSINWVARHDNVKDLEELIKLANEFNVYKINIVANKLTGDKTIDSELTKEDYEYLKEVLCNEDYKDILRIQNCYNILGVYCFDGNIPSITGCNAGKTFCAIDKNGMFFPCTHLYHKEKFESINEYWKNSNILKSIRENNIKGEICEKCKFNKKCNPCRAMNKDTHDNIIKSKLNECTIFQKI